MQYEPRAHLARRSLYCCRGRPGLPRLDASNLVAGEARSACSERGFTQDLRYGLPGQVEDIGRDGADLRGFEHQTPAGHACTLDALGDDAKHFLGLASVLPLAVAEIADGRTQQAARDRAVATSFLAMTGRAAGEVNRPPL